MSQVYTKTGDKAQDEKLLLPFTYIQQVPGKQIRTKLALAFNYWLKISEDKLRSVGEIVQMLHNSSLLIDDIQDNSILRRGIPVAHSIYGVASTINAANYIIIAALERTLDLGHPDATTVYTEQLLELHRGQGLEIYWRDNFQCPSEDEYKEMTIKKTGGLFMLAIRLMQLFTDNKSDFTKLTAILGLYFQIRDDYCNLCLQEYSENKSYCEDLTEGKFSFPIIHAIKTQAADKQVLHILRQRTRDIEVKRYCISLLERLGSFRHTRATLQQLDSDARAESPTVECTSEVEMKRRCISLLESVGSLRHTRATLHQLDTDARAEIERLGGNPLLSAVLDDLLSWRREKDIQNDLDYANSV